MTEETKQDYSKEEIDKARTIIRQIIQDSRDAYKKIVSEELLGDSPIELMAITRSGYPCQVAVDQEGVAKIFLKYDYPIYKALQMRAPKEMWQELAKEYDMSIVEDIIGEI